MLVCGRNFIADAPAVLVITWAAVDVPTCALIHGLCDDCTAGGTADIYGRIDRKYKELSLRRLPSFSPEGRA